MNLHDWHNLRYKPGRDYFLVGNGRISGVVQIDRSGPGSPVALILQDPHQFGLKWAEKKQTYLFDPQLGLEKTQLEIRIDGRPFTPVPFNLSAAWKDDPAPVVQVIWWAGFIRVTEEFFASASDPVLYRTITLEHRGTYACDADVRLTLCPNPTHAMEPAQQLTDAPGLFVTGSAGSLGLLLDPPVNSRAIPHIDIENHGSGSVSAENKQLAPGEISTASFIYLLTRQTDELRQTACNRTAQHSEQDLLQIRSKITTGCRLTSEDPMIDHLLRSVQRGLLATPSARGRVNAGIWQYNAEWVRDSSMVALGCLHAGLFDEARRIFSRILGSLVAPDGRTVIMGRFDEADFSGLEVAFTGGLPSAEHEQLDQAGALLYALEQYLLWTGDADLVQKFGIKILALARRLAQANTRNPETGLYHNQREYWERNHFEHGIEEGYELAYQLWPVLGLRAMAGLANTLQITEAQIQEWRSLANQTWINVLVHPTLNLVTNGRLCKRRQLDGTIQKTTRWTASTPQASEIPLGREKISFLEPCSSMVLPIVYGLIPGRDPLALRTLEAVETLWNLRWDTGGYDRYHTSSECDTPGPWPFASMFITRANHLAGNFERSYRTVQWLNRIQGGRTGTWHENMPTTLAQTDGAGIVPWIWGEIAMFLIRDVVGLRPTPTGIHLHPALFPKMKKVHATIPIRGKRLELDLDSRQSENSRYRVDHQDWVRIDPQGMEIPL